MRTSEIVGKAHRLCEWLREDDVPLYPKVSTVPMSWAVEDASKWHVGSPHDLPSGLDREIIDSMPLRLPVKQMLIEFDGDMHMADGRIEPTTGFILCYDRADEKIDCFMFGHGSGRFYFTGGCQVYMENGRRVHMHYNRQGKDTSGDKIVSQWLVVLEQTLVALNCTNVRSVDNVQSAALNKKRQRAGKPPLFTYKTLHVLAGDRSAPHSQRADDDEARTSPRLHFRRGHVRRVGDGRITWVQQCMVGNRRLGVVEKAYSIGAR